MRTLKKTLCLILCLAMMVGLCAIGANAITYDDYTDKETITYENAVKLMTALGVFNGYPDGTFGAQKNLTRAEGAKIMAEMLSKNVPEGTSSFTDMAGYEWAQKYVKFCEDYNIIAGVGDGKFEPGGTLSTTAFAKMLICALGYDAEKEGLVGASWAINTTMKVTALNLANGLTAFLPLEPITREAAAQLAYNTLFQVMVYPDGTSLQVSWVGDVLVGLGIIDNIYVTVKDGTPIPNRSYSYERVADNVLQFIEAAFPEIKVVHDYDEWGFPTAFWYKGKNAQDKTYKNLLCTTLDGQIMAVYDVGITGVTAKTFVSDAGFHPEAIGTIETFENGDWADFNIAFNAYAAPRARILADYAGAQVILFDEDYDSVADYAIVKYPYLAKVIAVQNAESRTVTLKLYKENPLTITYSSDTLVKGDYVLVYLAGNIAETEVTANDKIPVLAVKEVDVKNGTLSQLDLDETAGYLVEAMTVGGESYDVGSDYFAYLGPKGNVVRCSAKNYDVGVGSTAYLSYGYVLGIIPDSEVYSDWVFAVETDAKAITNAFGGVDYYAGIVKQDATAYETIIYGQTKALYDAGKGLEKLKWYNPTPITTTSTLFTGDKAKTVTKEIKGLRSDHPALDADYEIVTDTQTKFIIWDNVNGTFTAYTGINKVANFADDATMVAYALVPSKGAHAVAVVIQTNGNLPEGEIADPIYVLKQYPMQKSLDDKTKVWTYRVVKDGELTTIMAKDTVLDKLTERGLVIPTYDPTGKYVTKVEQLKKGENNIIILATPAEGKITVENNTMCLNGAYYIVNDATVVYMIDKTGKTLKKLDFDALESYEGGFVTAIAVSKFDDTLKTIWYDMYIPAPLA